MTTRPGSVADAIDQDHAFAMRLMNERDVLAMMVRNLCDIIEVIAPDLPPEVKVALELAVNRARSVLR